MTTEIATTGTKAMGTPKGGRTLQDFLNSPQVLSRLSSVADKAMKPEALVRAALVAANRTPLIAKCSQTSILRALLDAQELGIRPGGLGGVGYLVPRKNRKTGEYECNLDPGYRGLMEIARRSKLIDSFSAHVVRANDHYRVVYGIEEKIEHEPLLTGDAGEVVGAYAIARFKTGGYQAEFLTRAEIDKVRKGSAASNAGPWVDWFDEMARKTAIRRLCKFLPIEPEVQEALEAALSKDVDQVVFDVVDGGGRANALNAKLDSAPALPEADDDGVIKEPAQMREPGED